MMRESWQEVEFSEIVEDSAFGPRFSGAKYSDNGNIATLRTTDMSEDGKIAYEQMPRAILDEAKFAKHYLQENDLVISRSGRIGTTAVFKGFEIPVLPGAFFISISTKSKGQPLFLSVFIQFSDGKATYPLCCSGSCTAEHRRFKNEVQHLEVFAMKAHRDSLMFTTTTRHPHELYPA
jgi:type I restriction enzyme S subunit